VSRTRFLLGRNTETQRTMHIDLLENLIIRAHYFEAVKLILFFSRLQIEMRRQV
jgi:hypothetical protein